MRSEKVQAILRKERPDLVEVEKEGGSLAAGDDDAVSAVDERETSSDVWKRHRRDELYAEATAEATPMAERKFDPTQGMSANEIRQTFAPRQYASRSASKAPAGSDSAEASDSQAGFVRVVKRKDEDTVIASNMDASGSEAKDLFVDEDEGILGSQG